MLLPFQRRMLGKARIVTPGSASYGPGTYTFVVPEYNTLILDFCAAGGGGGGGVVPPWSAATGGGFSGVASDGIYATGGAPGTNTAVGADGTGVGGDSNVPGGGALGGAGVFTGKKGGNGGRVIKTFVYGATGAWIPGTTKTVAVGVGGAPSQYGGNTASPGVAGFGSISWT